MGSRPRLFPPSSPGGGGEGGGGGGGGGGGISASTSGSSSIGISSSSTTSSSRPGGGGGALATRFHIQDVEQVNALWKRVKEEVLDPLEVALQRHFDPKATEVVRAKYYDIYT